MNIPQQKLYYSSLCIHLLISFQILNYMHYWHKYLLWLIFVRFLLLIKTKIFFTKNFTLQNFKAWALKYFFFVRNSPIQSWKLPWNAFKLFMSFSFLTYFFTPIQSLQHALRLTKFSNLSFTLHAIDERTGN